MKKTVYFLFLLFAGKALISGNWNPLETHKLTEPFPITIGTAAAPSGIPAAFKTPATSNYKSRIGFEENKGQWPNQVQFKTDLGDGKRLFFEKNKFTYTLYNAEEVKHEHDETHTVNKKENSGTFKSHAFEMVFINSNLYTELEGSEANEFHHNYYLGNDPSKWATDVAVYKKITYKNLYEGIDLIAYESDNNFKYDYVVKQGAIAASIQLKFNGADKLEVRGKNLSILTSVGEVVESVPYAYQKIDGKEIAVACEYKLLRDRQTVVFNFPQGYDPNYELIIDPILVGSTYSGSTSQNYGHCATFDASGNIYTGGRAFGNGYPVTTGAVQLTYAGNMDIVISKLNPTGTALLYATYIGGTSADYPHSMFVNANNELYVYGSTTSTNFPTSAGAYDNSYNGTTDADMYVSKFNSTGTSLLGSTYIGGSGEDGSNLNAVQNYGDTYRGEIVVGPTGDIFIAGTTASTNFPVSSGAYDVTQNGAQDAVVLKMNSSLTALTWATYIGGSGNETGCSLRLNQAGDVYFVGLTAGGFPIVTGAQTAIYQGGTYDGYIARLNSTGTSLINSTYIGSGGIDIAYFVEIDVFGDIYTYGISDGTMPISAGVYFNANSVNFLQKLNPSLSTQIYATTLGNGTKNNFSPSAFLVDLCQNVYLCGWGSCSGYSVTTSALQATTTGSGFHLMVLSPGASSMQYGTFFGPGGEHVDGGTSRFDPQGLVYQAVCEGSASFPTLSNAYSPTKLTTSYDIAVFKIDFQVNCNPLYTNTIICLGKTASISITNVNTLLNPTYSIQPGGLVSSTPFFTVSPTTTTSYTVYVTGTNGFNAIVTNTGISTVSIAPSPSLSPSFTQATCSSTANAFNLNLSFVPSSSTPTYGVFWSPIPNGITSTLQTSATGGIAPGVYHATVTTLPYGCKTSTTFTIDPIPTSVSFSLAGPTVINCFNPSVTINISPATYSYTWLGLTATYSGSSATFSLGQAGSWTVNAIDPIAGCGGTHTFAITQDISPTTSSVTPLTQNITCTLTSITTVTAVSNPSVNISHYWISPSGGTLTMNNNPALFVPGSPGTYTHITINNINGCSVTKTFTVSSTSGFPTFNVTSPQNFTLGCSSKSLATINIVNAQTSPTPGGSVTYTILSPTSSTLYLPNPQVTYTVSEPGTYTVITKDNTNSCESKIQISVLQNTATPNISAIVPATRLTCYTPSVILEGVSTTTNTSYLWSFPGTPGNVSGNTISVISNSVATNNTLVATYTLTITDDNNSCQSYSIIPIEQNLFPPNPSISGTGSITCNTPTLILTNQSTSSIPAVFPHPLFVQAYIWDGPSPQEQQQLTTTYIAGTPGIYTLTARDLNNGCFAIGTKSVSDFRSYPDVLKTADPFILDCGDAAQAIFPTIVGNATGLTYSWTTVAGSTISSVSSRTLSVNRSGQYSIIITNTLNGCSAGAIVEVTSGSLQAAFVADPISGYAPLAVTFTNTSFSSSTLTPNANITSYWNFGNATSYSTSTQNSVGPIVYTQPGTYKATMYAQKGECLDSTLVTISVEIPSELSIPNIFSPNGDGSNDLFFLKASNLEKIDVMITDRWGHTVYELVSASGNIAWDGKNQSGKESAAGVYFYTLKANGKDGSSYNKKGTVTLVR